MDWVVSRVVEWWQLPGWREEGGARRWEDPAPTGNGAGGEWLSPAGRYPGRRAAGLGTPAVPAWKLTAETRRTRGTGKSDWEASPCVWLPAEDEGTKCTLCSTAS